MKVKVAVLQYDVPLDTFRSIQKLDEMVGQASWVGAKLVVAPETAVGDVGEVKNTGRDYLKDLSIIADKYKVYLSTSYYKKEGGQFFNQGYILDEKGCIVVDYRKIYPAKPEVDNIGVKSGKALIVKETPLGKLAMIICKDGFNKYSHFLYEKLGEEKTDITCIPTWSLDWTKALGNNNSEYIKALYVYGAFLSRSFFLVAGNLNKNTGSFGRSLIISPTRGVLREGSETKKEILVEELDLDEVKRGRDFDFWWQPKKKIL